MNITRISSSLLYLLTIMLLSACSDQEPVRLGPLQWQEIQFIVESRPSPVRKGMNEFMVIATREGVKPGVGLIVELRVNDSGEWRQAIQDGYTGVYRRAIMVNDPQRDVLSVHVRNTRAEQGEEKETILRFPLNPS